MADDGLGGTGPGMRVQMGNDMPATQTGRVSVSAIRADDVDEVAAFLHVHLDSAISAAEWSAAIIPPWSAERPDHGFQLRAEGRLVGVYVAYYSPKRALDSGSVRFCNLAAWTVLEGYRSQGVLLLMALLKQRGLAFTDLTADRPEVVQMDRRLGFLELDTTAYLAINVPGIARGVRVVTGAREVAEVLGAKARQEYLDHAGIPGLEHLALVGDGRGCHVAYRVRTVPLRRLGGRSLTVARMLHVSDPALYRRGRGAVARHLLVRGIPLSWAEERMTGPRPRLAREDTILASHRLYRGEGLSDDDIDYLYSEAMFV